MNRNDILEKLKEILLSADESSRDVIHLVNENTNLHTGLGLSSVNMLYLKSPPRKSSASSLTISV